MQRSTATMNHTTLSPQLRQPSTQAHIAGHDVVVEEEEEEVELLSEGRGSAQRDGWKCRSGT